LANTPAGKKVAVILDGMTLREAAQVPDTIKGWDKKGVEDPKNAAYFSSRPRIAAQLREFWKANQPTHENSETMPSHHWFHYTDVPIEAANYASGTTGRGQWDIVRMSSYCIAVLRGEIPEENPRKITKAVAIILLAHYLGDIHQPLHVGAQYFDQGGRPVNPDLGKPALEDQGGNTILLDIPGGTTNKRPKFHGFWDNDPVKAMFPGGTAAMEKDERKTEMNAAETNLAHAFATQEPKGWRMPPGLALKNYPEAWANEILPIAREAHERLIFLEMRATPQENGTTLATGSARERPMPDGLSYRAWSAIIVRAQLPKAGWRLADLLEKALASGNEQSTTLAAPAPAASASAAPSPGLVAAPSAPNASPYGAYPTNYKEIVTAWLKSNVPDAANTTIQFQTEPKPADLPGAAGRKLYGYLVIFNTSSRNGAGVAGRAQTHAALIRDGQVLKADGF
jgi:hypothetical protein